jgi:hypothetical protein
VRPVFVAQTLQGLLAVASTPLAVALFLQYQLERHARDRLILDQQYPPHRRRPNVQEPRQPGHRERFVHSRRDAEQAQVPTGRRQAGVHTHQEPESGGGDILDVAAVEKQVTVAEVSKLFGQHRAVRLTQRRTGQLHDGGVRKGFSL